jgi:hypothetical protein
VRGHSLWAVERVRLLVLRVEMHVQRLSGMARLALLALPQPVNLAERAQDTASRGLLYAVLVEVQDACGACAGRNSIGRC